MSNNQNPNKHTALALDQKTIAGVDKYFANVNNMTVAGTTYTVAALKAVFQADIDATNALDASRAHVMQQVATTREARAKARATRQALRAYVLGNYGADAVQMLQDLGMSAPKPKSNKTAQVKANAVIKSKATREARHTMGKKQKQPIKGVLPAKTQPHEAASNGAVPQAMAPAVPAAAVSDTTHA